MKIPHEINGKENIFILISLFLAFGTLIAIIDNC
jgi:hypothetical protein